VSFAAKILRLFCIKMEPIATAIIFLILVKPSKANIGNVQSVIGGKMIKKHYTQRTDCGMLAVEGKSPMVWFVRDLENRAERVKHLEFHIEQGDYFSVLATIINIALKEPDFEKEKIFSKLYEDLQYLQENYEIVKKKHQ